MAKEISYLMPAHDKISDKNNCQIAILLPSREGFDPKHFGAIALCVKDFVENSQYKHQSTVFGAVSMNGFPNINYVSLQIKRHKLLLESRSAAYSRAFLKHILQIKPNLVEIHNRPNLVLSIANKWPGKIALHLHNDPQQMKFAHSAKQRINLLEKCSAIYCVSDYIKSQFLEDIADEDGKVFTIYNGFAVSNIPTVKQKQIVFIGRLQPEKGAKEFVAGAMTTLRKYPDWKAVIIGAARHQPNAPTTNYEKQIHKLLSQAGNNIQMLGFCSHEATINTLLESEIAVIPSCWNEAFGRTALEAMACGCATISSTRGGLDEVIGNAAYRLQEVTASTIAAAISDFIENPQLRAQYKQQAIRQAKKFNITSCTNHLDKIRQQIIST